jgi:hypothetical protein
MWRPSVFFKSITAPHESTTEMTLIFLAIRLNSVCSIIDEARSHIKTVGTFASHRLDIVGSYYWRECHHWTRDCSVFKLHPLCGPPKNNQCGRYGTKDTPATDWRARIFLSLVCIAPPPPRFGECHAKGINDWITVLHLSLTHTQPPTNSGVCVLPRSVLREEEKTTTINGSILDWQKLSASSHRYYRTD